MSQADNLAALGSNVNTSGVLQPAGGGTGTTTATGTGSVVLSSGATLTNATINGAVASGFTMKNRIINGDMVIDQRNNGASVSTTTTNSAVYTVDRWFYQVTQASKFTVQQDAGAVTPPEGFNDYLGITSTSAYSVTSSDYLVIGQTIEGFNVADLGFGTANAKTITLSFWIRSSLTGTFGGALRGGNSAANAVSYPFTYTISAANTWTKISLTIPGATIGASWQVTNGAGLQIWFSMGSGSSLVGTAGSWQAINVSAATGSTNIVGTNGATWYITGVQLEQGSAATSFEWLPIGAELALCQRYYQKMTSVSAFTSFGSGTMTNAGAANIYVKYPTTMRSQPTSSQSSLMISTTANFAISGTTLYAGNDCCLLQYAVSGATAGHGAVLLANNSTTAFLDFAAEL